MNNPPSGAGYAHATHNPPRQPKKLVTIAQRWTAYWEPRAVLEAKRSDDPADALRTLRDAYHRRSTTLLRAGIAWTTVTRGNLDSPLQSGTEFDRALCLAIERRRARMGRIKGRTKTRARRKVTHDTRY